MLVKVRSICLGEVTDIVCRDLKSGINLYICLCCVVLRRKLRATT